MVKEKLKMALNFETAADPGLPYCKPHPTIHNAVSLTSFVICSPEYHFGHSASHLTVTLLFCVLWDRLVSPPLIAEVPIVSLGAGIQRVSTGKRVFQC